MTEITANAAEPRYLRCTCGHVLGTIARDRRGPVCLTPDPAATLLLVTGAIVWLRCVCGVESPWICQSGRGVVPPQDSTVSEKGR